MDVFHVFYQFFSSQLANAGQHLVQIGVHRRVAQIFDYQVRRAQQRKFDEPPEYESAQGYDQYRSEQLPKGNCQRSQLMLYAIQGCGYVLGCGWKREYAYQKDD